MGDQANDSAPQPKDPIIVQAEKQKILAEAEKITMETRILEKSHKRKFISTEQFIKWFVAGIVAGLAILTWYISFTKEIIGAAGQMTTLAEQRLEMANHNFNILQDSLNLVIQGLEEELVTLAQQAEQSKGEIRSSKATLAQYADSIKYAQTSYAELEQNRLNLNKEITDKRAAVMELDAIIRDAGNQPTTQTLQTFNRRVDQLRQNPVIFPGGTQGSDQ
ncbi:MAG: hypothetical protein R3F48_09415 [Candidatus Zixiibacteriota bacterium]